jgi:predicted ATP-dependent endonuclease of OLD family
MILKTVRFQNFKCIDDSTEFSLGPVTCLVGKNEAGKSATLQALYKLNPVEDDRSKFNELEEYPRKGLSDYEDIKEKSPANVLTTVWELEDKDISLIQKRFGIDFLRTKSVTIKKGYNNVQYWTIDADESKLLSLYLKQLQTEPAEMWEGKKMNTIAELTGHLENIKTPSDNQSKVLAEIKKAFPKSNVVQSVIDVLDDCLPTFLYFPEYQKMAGRIAFDDLARKIAEKRIVRSEKIFLALLDLAGTSPEEFQKLGKLEHLIARLEGVSNRITQEIFRYWSQNKHLEVDFRFDTARPQDQAPFNSGYVFSTRIRNTRHGVTVGFDERSSGFVWFFSFLVWFSQVRKTYGDNLFILLDEPGLSLHAKAQADLLRYINERLRPNFQVLYSTHSPFMVDPENILTVRTVEDVVQDGQILGTKIGDKVLSTDADTLFPLQAALGYEITQTLFVGKHTLLVEGPSDLLYLKWFSQELQSQGRTALDIRWVISPSGGIDKIGSFVSLFGANKLNLAVLTDFHDGDKKKVRSLRESNILKGGHVFTADTYTGETEADIEDLIGRPSYVTLVNESYKLEEKNKLPEKKPAKSAKRVIAEVEDHFRTLPPDVIEFDHFQPASYLVENGPTLKKKLSHLPEALDRFEKLFKDINAALKT